MTYRQADVAHRLLMLSLLATVWKRWAQPEDPRSSAGSSSSQSCLECKGHFEVSSCVNMARLPRSLSETFIPDVTDY